MNKKSKAALMCLSLAGIGFFSWRTYKKELKKVKEDFKASDEQSKQLGIKNPELENYIDDGIDNDNIVLKTMSKIVRNLGEDEESIWTSDVLSTSYYLDPVNEFFNYNDGTIHVIQNFEGMENTVTLMIQLPPYIKPEEYSTKPVYTSGDYIRAIKSCVKDFIDDVSYPWRPDFDICGYYEIINPNTKDVNYVKIPSSDYKNYDEHGDGLSRYVSVFYKNDRALLKKSQYNAVNMYVKYTFRVVNDGMDDMRLLRLIKELLFEMKVKQKNSNSWKNDDSSEDEDNYTELSGVVFHRENLEWFYEYNKNTNKIDEFTFNVDED